MKTRTMLDHPNLIDATGKLRVAEGRRVKLWTGPGDWNHRKVRKVADLEPYYMVEDSYGNTGMYKAAQLEIV